MEAFIIWLKTYEDPLQTIGGIVGLFATGIGFYITFLTFRKEAEARRLSNWLFFTQQHRDIWKMHLEIPGLGRVRDPLADLTKDALTEAEHVFVSMLVHHLSAVNKAASAEMVEAPAGLQMDIKAFFALPVPLAVWKNIRHLHDEVFVKFVESCLNEGHNVQ